LKRRFNSHPKRILKSPLQSARPPGFTLIEVLISLAILTFISMSIYQGTTQTFRMRDVVIFNGIRLSMSVLERDLNMLFSPISFIPAPAKRSNPGAIGGEQPSSRRSGGTNPNDGDTEEFDPNNADFQNSDLARTTDFWIGATNKAGVKMSRFTGEAEKVSFIAASHQRLYKDRQESEFIKVTYELREEKNEEFGIEGTKTLYKIIDTNVFDDVEKKDTSKKVYPILPGVKKITFRYYRRQKKSWDRTFDNSKNDDLKNTYPDLVEVKLEVSAGKRLNFDGIYVLKPGISLYGLDRTF
jgi:prepilin-type N-terminal cleavage/methylation domain-containing protein